MTTDALVPTSLVVLSRAAKQATAAATNKTPAYAFDGRKAPLGTAPLSKLSLGTVLTDPMGSVIAVESRLESPVRAILHARVAATSYWVAAPTVAFGRIRPAFKFTPDGGVV